MNKMLYPFLLLLGASSYGVHASMVKLALDEGFSIQHVTGNQYLFGLIMLVFMLPFFKKIKPTKKELSMLMLVGTFLSMTGIMYALSLERNSASLSIILLFQFSWIGILLESIWEKKLPSIEKGIAILLLLIGTGFAGQLFTEGIGNVSLDGLIYGLLSAICFSLYLFAGGKVAKRIPSLERSVILTMGGSLLVLVVFSPAFIFDGTLFETSLWKFSFLTGLFGVVFPVALFAIAAPKVEASHASIIGSAELPASIICAMIFLHEHISALQWFGIGLIVIGIVIPQFRFSNTRKHPKQVSA
ncbi:EamA family transporter [Peribacillus acanthi]|uniref:EamA family transporter n=1 Tax=Peribacillus acanthi TaxID=2171554 RepID=UPI000D3EBC1C|nr:DMT family transporter [Peribacillus acanthi]